MFNKDVLKELNEVKAKIEFLDKDLNNVVDQANTVYDKIVSAINSYSRDIGDLIQYRKDIVKENINHQNWQLALKVEQEPFNGIYYDKWNSVILDINLRVLVFCKEDNFTNMSLDEIRKLCAEIREKKSSDNERFLLVRLFEALKEVTLPVQLVGELKDISTALTGADVLKAQLMARKQELQKIGLYLSALSREKMSFKNILTINSGRRSYTTDKVGIALRGIIFQDSVTKAEMIMTWNGNVGMVSGEYEYKTDVSEDEILALFKKGDYQLTRLATLIAKRLSIDYAKLKLDESVGKIEYDGRDAIEMFFFNSTASV